MSFCIGAILFKEVIDESDDFYVVSCDTEGFEEELEELEELEEIYF